MYDDVTTEVTVVSKTVILGCASAADRRRETKRPWWNDRPSGLDLEDDSGEVDRFVESSGYGISTSSP